MTRRVLITAGAAGIGLAMGRSFAAEGYDVWVCDRDADAIGLCPGTWKTSVTDVTDPDDMANMFAAIDQTWGGLDVLCANAGVAGPTAMIEDIEPLDWRNCLAVNLDGTFLAAKFAARMMKKAGSGAIIVTSSTAGLYGYPNRAPYAAAKWGVIGLTKTLAMELGPFGIRANAICPGSVEGARMDGVLEREAAAKGMTPQQVYSGYASGTSMKRFVEDVDIAEMAVFLASDKARLVSGQVIAVDGHTVNPDP